MSGAQVPAGVTHDTVDAIADARDEPDWLRERRHEALDALPALDRPDVIRTPGRRWTDLDDLDLAARVDATDQRDATDREHDGGAVVTSIADAVAEHPDRVREALGSTVDPDENALTALSAAVFTAGTFVYVPEGVDAGEVTVRTTAESRSLFGHTLVVAERGAEVTVLERVRAGADAPAEQYVSNLVEVTTGANASVQFGSLQTLPGGAYHYALKRGAAARDASVDWIEGTIGGRLVRSDVETDLDGDGSETKTVGAFFGHEDQHVDVNARVWHHGEHTTADLVTRGVLDDAARSVYEGVQDVGRDAWDTSSYQRENTLMLSDDSEADASPKLIIHNHDTEASHSATVGQVDADDLFYMTSRGLSEREARNTLVEGFFVPVLEEIAIDEFRDELRERVRRRLR